jgi:hypothetical protein
MTERPELHLVDEVPPTPEELAAIEAEARALAGGSLDPIDHEALLAMALGDDVLDGTIFELERADAEALRTALDAGGAHPLAALAVSLRHADRASTPSRDGLDPLDHEALLALTLGDDTLDERVLRGERARAGALAARLDRSQNDASQLSGDSSEAALVELAASLRAAHRPGTLDEVAVERVVRRALRGNPAAALVPTGRRSVWPIASAFAALAAGVALWLTGTPDRAELAGASRSPGASQLHEAAAPLAKDRRDGATTGDAAVPAPAAAAPASPRPDRFAAAAEPMGERKTMTRSPERSASGARPRSATDDVALRDEAAEAPVARGGGSAGPEPRRSEEPGRLAEVLAGAVSPFASRSTASLFDPSTPFSVKGGESGRMARIVSARSSELRANRFAAWGIR